ncbi:SDR family oxidoreductase [Bradyrhizobium yuanmingense]|uniref:SDR family oxidoreductase n=1 Tax=Bradyrhizobium yuanmingense TaxID=108015 RepID=UPI0023B9D753|nr:SDR family oxidoreductase [Bradyrhizobium yuanmingense]MDF0498645.1 SDR family oxidoreductase [Bradyrhizobium yuanmingense]
MTTVLITGANRGVGLALAREYTSSGADVIACCRDPAKADALKELERASGGRVRILPLDVTDETSIASLKTTLGDQAIDILINNAGVLGPKNQSPDGIDAEGWMSALRVNALAPVLLSLALADNLKRSREKKLVAISSDYGSVSIVWPPTTSARNRYAYRASKAALNSGMRALSSDWAADGVIVGLFNPGWVQTDMGGPTARITAEQSASGLVRRIAELTAETSGCFNDYDGKPIAW